MQKFDMDYIYMSTHLGFCTVVGGGALSTNVRERIMDDFISISIFIFILNVIQRTYIYTYMYMYVYKTQISKKV